MRASLLPSRIPIASAAPTIKEPARRAVRRAAAAARRGRCRRRRRSARPRLRGSASPDARAAAWAGPLQLGRADDSMRPSLRSSKRRISCRATIRCLTIQCSDPPTQFGRALRPHPRRHAHLAASGQRATRRSSVSRLAQLYATLVRWTFGTRSIWREDPQFQRT